MANPKLFFSVLNELARTAKQAMPLEQWQRYLVPGKVLERGGVRFPLRADEVKYGPFAELQRLAASPDDLTHGMNLSSGRAISPVEMAGQLQKLGKEGHYPEFRIDVPLSSWEPGARTAPGGGLTRMHYENQYQLPGEKLGQAEELTLLPGSDFVPSTSHFGGQPGLVSWSRVTRRPVVGGETLQDRIASGKYNVKMVFENGPNKYYSVFDDNGYEIGDRKTSPEAAIASVPAAKYGSTTTHLEEIQSDLHQRAREEGYEGIGQLTPDEYKELQDLRSKYRGVYIDNSNTDYIRWGELSRRLKRGVPAAPYKDTYAELELRKGIARALAQGDDYVTWTTGDQQADRWGQALRNSVDAIHWVKTPDGRYTLIPMKNGRELVADERFENLTHDQLHDTVGSDIAKRIVEGEGLKELTPKPISDEQIAAARAAGRGGEADWLTEQRKFIERQKQLGGVSPFRSDPAAQEGVVSGDDLTIGGAGMRLFYDRKVKDAAERLAKQYGGEVTRIKIPGVPAGGMPKEYRDVMLGIRNTDPKQWDNDVLHQTIREILPHGMASGDGSSLGNTVGDFLYSHQQYLDAHDAWKTGQNTGAEAARALSEYHNQAQKLTTELDKAYQKPTDQEVHALRLTPQMKDNVRRAGLPLFSAAPAAVGLGAGAYAGLAPDTGQAAEPQQPQGYASGGLVKDLIKAAEDLIPKLQARGVEIRNDPHGVWVLPTGHGVGPFVKGMGIVNHHDVAGLVDDLSGRGLHPTELNNELLNRGWLRVTGYPPYPSYQIGSLKNPQISNLEKRLDWAMPNTDPNTQIYLENVGEKKLYKFTSQDYLDNGSDILKTLRNADRSGNVQNYMDGGLVSSPDHLAAGGRPTAPNPYAYADLPAALAPAAYAYAPPPEAPLGALGGLPRPALPGALTAFGLDQLRPGRNRAPRAPRIDLNPGLPAEPAIPDYHKCRASLTAPAGALPEVKPVDYGGGAGNPGLAAAPPGPSGGSGQAPAPATVATTAPAGQRPFLDALAGAEGGPHPDQPVAGSSALGPYRFTEGTWADVVRQHPDLNLTPEGRTDPRQARAAARALALDHARALAAVGDPPTDANLHVLHFLGQGDGMNLLYAAQAAPDDQAAAHVSRGAVSANRDVFYDRTTGQPRTVAQVYALMHAGFEGSTFAAQYLPPQGDIPARMAEGGLVKKLFEVAGDVVDGLTVGEHVPNTSSIGASFNDYHVLRGIRSVPMSEFNSSPHDLFYAADDHRRVADLANEIRYNGRIDPLIVAIDNEEKPYILEGAHRLGALHQLGKREFPAMVVLDQDKDIHPRFQGLLPESR